MAKLTTRSRDKLPNKDFAGPGRSYPIEDRAHAANAKARAKQQWEKGKLSDAEYESIVKKADRELAATSGGEP
jgi:hypothetical protein